MGVGGVVLFLGAGRGALRVITTRAGGRSLWLGAACVVAYPLAFYTSMSDAGVAVGVPLSIGSAPIVTALFERIVHGRMLTRRWVATVVVSVIGAAALGYSGADLGNRGRRKL
jgi:drug/metabolite transporter, DME family